MSPLVDIESRRRKGRDEEAIYERILREDQVGQENTEQLCRERGASQPIYYAWKRKYA